MSTQPSGAHPLPQGSAAAHDRLASAERIVVLTGAGISTDSGIPDFRGPNGLWTKNPAAEKASNIDYYLNDPEVRRAAWQHRIDAPAFTAEPNRGHRAIVELERTGRLLAVVTQNVDGLHQKAGNDPGKVIEVHGTVWFTRCWDCQDRRAMSETLDRVRAGEGDPSCLVCGGILKSDTISFGQALIPEVIDRAMRVSDQCDVLLAVGSTLSVFPAANCVPRAKAGGAAVIIVNGQETAMDRYADWLLVGEIGEILPDICRQRCLAGLRSAGGAAAGEEGAADDEHDADQSEWRHDVVAEHDAEHERHDRDDVGDHRGPRCADASDQRPHDHERQPGADHTEKEHRGDRAEFEVRVAEAPQPVRQRPEGGEDQHVRHQVERPVPLLERGGDVHRESVARGGEDHEDHAQRLAPAVVERGRLTNATPTKPTTIPRS